MINKDGNILGSILGFSCFGKLPRGLGFRGSMFNRNQALCFADLLWARTLTT